MKEALKVLAPSSFSLPASDASSMSLRGQKGQGHIIALNTVHSPRREIVSVDLSPDATSPSLLKHLKSDLVQIAQDGRTGYAIAENLAGAGFAPVTGLFAASAGARAFQTNEGDFVLKNEGIKMTLSKGRIISLFDTKVGRELIPVGTTAGLQMFEDRYVRLASEGSE